MLKVLEACQKSARMQSDNAPLTNPGSARRKTGESYFVHPTSIVEEPSSIGEGTSIWHFSHIMPRVSIGEGCTLGQNVFVGQNVSLGNNVKIQNNVSVYDGVTLEDDVFCGPSCVFTNVRAPRSHLPQGGRYSATLVRKGATIGANATIICGNTIGRYAFIGAGSVVTSDIPDYGLAHGNPARVEGWVCECGTRLDFGDGAGAKCPRCGAEYARRDSEGEVAVEKSGP